MARSGKSQWEFTGELFSPAETRLVESVTELTQKLKRQLEGAFASRWVSGEISNLRLQASGHAYFVLKDAGAQLNCVLFRGQDTAGKNALRDGAKVVLGGDLTVYEPRGAYQLRVTQVELQGIGALQAAFERLKAGLAAEGLFDQARKKAIPRFPVRIGIVTSPTGAAIRDVLHVLERRFAPEIILEPVRVQGQGAAAEIAGAVARLNRFAAQGERLDLILLTRGGGSLEDLWCFNEEVVARAIAASAVPVISAVGHEIDFTIADFIADLRAATPSAAAEIISENYVASREFVADAGDRLLILARRRLAEFQSELGDLFRRMGRSHPRRLLEMRFQTVDDLGESLRLAALRGLREQRHALASRQQRLALVKPSVRLKAGKVAVETLTAKLRLAPLAALELRRRKLADLLNRLRLLSPQNVLDRGYSMTMDAETGAVVRDAAVLKSGRRLKTRLQHGEVSSVVTRVSENALSSPGGAIAPLESGGPENPR